MNQKPILFVISAVILVLFIVGNTLLANQSNENTVTEETVQEINSQIDTSQWQTITVPGFDGGFKYPPDWEISTSVEGGNLYRLLLISPRDFVISASLGPTGVGGTCETDDNLNVDTEPILIDHRTYFIHYYGNADNQTISYAYLQETDRPCANIPFISVPNEVSKYTPWTGEDIASLRMYFENDDSVDFADFRSQDMATAKEILKSVFVNEF